MQQQTRYLRKRGQALTTKKKIREDAVKVIENTWIPLSDGSRLAARLWLPADACENPVPAILEYLPYRKSDGTAFRDAMMHPYFAAHGYAVARVDIRGSGDSDGILEGEYLPLEQQDALEVLRWLAAQPWCTGDIGMMGISWGGFNSLQVAALRPPELKAIVTLCSTDDRYTDDCHYMGGCVLGSDMLNWASIMLSYNGLPPDPAVVGERWREIWFDRLEKSPPFVEQWLSHQLRDDFWKQGSVIEDYSAINCAVYAIGGWVDPYTNAVPRLLEGLPGPRKGLIGPWAHVFPHQGIPGPAIGFLQECLRWWDHWLKGVENGIMDEPMLRVWMPEAIPAQAHEAEWPGRWVAEERWPPSGIHDQVYLLDDGCLTEKPGPERELSIRGAQVTGLGAGVWCPYGTAIGMPLDQRADDGLSLCFTTSPLEEPIEILGFPTVKLRLSVDQPNALLAIRLCDVAPDGGSRLVSWGLLNLTHRNGHEVPEPLVPGKVYSIAVQLNAAAHSLGKGHRWRLAVSPTYWPHAWPSPKAVRLSLYTGEDSSCLILPLRKSKSLDLSLPPFDPPESSPPPDADWLRPEGSSRNLQYDVAAQRLQIIDCIDEGRLRLADNDLVYDSTLENIYSIVEGEPLSARVRCTRCIEISRGDWITRVKTLSVMTSDENHFHLTNVIDAYEGEVRVFTKSWATAIPREHV
ncbi:MAG TPA: CocE/NonD family hydrolase [Firmicutes bacterium]|nr:CocE/NonD family hydrolase [Bacillota bacterium]